MSFYYYYTMFHLNNEPLEAAVLYDESFIIITTIVTDRLRCIPFLMTILHRKQNECDKSTGFMKHGVIFTSM